MKKFDRLDASLMNQGLYSPARIAQIGQKEITGLVISLAILVLGNIAIFFQLVTPTDIPWRAEYSAIFKKTVLVFNFVLLVLFPCGNVAIGSQRLGLAKMFALILTYIFLVVSIINLYSKGWLTI